jgi:hypothetical protein
MNFSNNVKELPSLIKGEEFCVYLIEYRLLQAADGDLKSLFVAYEDWSLPKVASSYGV